MSRRIGPLHLRIIESSQLSKLGIKHSFKDNKFIGIFCYDLVSKEIIENSFKGLSIYYVSTFWGL